jgi:cytochrome c553
MTRLSRVLTLSALLAAAPGLTWPEALTVAAWSRAAAAQPPGDPARGAQRYAEHGCGACHGPAGVADNPAWPVLAGQRPLYLYKTLLDFREGRMAGPDAAVMAPMAAGLDEAAIADLSAWLGGLPRPRASSAARQAPAVLGGDRERLVPPCEACHGANGQGWDVQPALSGQNEGYFARTLLAFKEGRRTNDINAGMAQIAQALSEAEIRALAEYFCR